MYQPQKNALRRSSGRARHLFLVRSHFFSTFDTRALNEHFNDYKHLSYYRGKAACTKVFKTICVIVLFCTFVVDSKG